MEKLYIRLQRPLPDIDHIKAIDPELFASFHGRWDNVASLVDVERINDFYIYEGEYGKGSVRWYRACKGLKAVRAVLDHYRSGRGDVIVRKRSQRSRSWRTFLTLLT